MIDRRSLLAGAPAAALSAAALPAAALDLRPAALPLRLDDTVAPGVQRDVLIRWGDRVTFDAPPWAPRSPTPEAAASQFGWDGRIVALVPAPQAEDGTQRALLAVVHPTVDAALAFPGGRDRPAVAAEMQGATLLNLLRQGGRWIVVDGGFQTRRITGSTLCRIAGPAGAAAGNSVRGVLGPAGGCATPWGSLLLAEDDPTGWTERLGRVDARFRESLRFGWVVEVDPRDPQSVPVKRTALGRMPHGDAAATTSADGRAVVYLTDRSAFGFLFRFVSAGPATDPDALDAGTLSAARVQGAAFRWVALPAGAETALRPMAAAERAGATRFDLPSGLAIDARTGRAYMACRGNAARTPGQVDPMNPRAGNASGHVIEWVPAGGDHAAETASAGPLFIAGDPSQPGSGARYGRGAGSPVPPGATWPESPDTLSVDDRSRLWIGTNRGGRPLDQPEALFACDLAGAMRGVPVPLYGAPRGAAIGGTASSPEGEALFAMVRHPGLEPGASFEAPATGWPSFEPGMPPRSTLVTFTRSRGGRVGG